jgi:hypothetical protein
MSMSKSELFAGSQGFFGSKFIRVGSGMPAQSLEYFLATGLGSRGGPNKASNKLRSSPASYASGNAAVTTEYFLATGLRSRGGPNKVSNKLKRCPGSYLFH